MPSHTELGTVNLSDFAGDNVTWKVFSDMVTVGLILAIAGTFPLQLFVVIDICEAFMFAPGRLSSEHLYWKSNIFRSVLVVAAAAYVSRARIVAIENEISIISRLRACALLPTAWP